MYRHKAEKALIELFVEVYKVASPPLDFNEVWGKAKRGEQMPQDWFLAHKIERSVEDKLIKAVCKKHKLNEYWSKAVSMNYYLGCSPMSEGRNE